MIGKCVIIILSNFSKNKKDTNKKNKCSTIFSILEGELGDDLTKTNTIPALFKYEIKIEILVPSKIIINNYNVTQEYQNKFN